MVRQCAVAAKFAAILFSLAAVCHYRGLVRGNLIALLDLPYSMQTTASLAVPVEAKLVAHAGGAIRNITYTNSREALEKHYTEGYRVFELDFHWTSDARLVVVHDWTDMSMRFGTVPHVFSYNEFVSAKRRDGLHQLTFEDLRVWLQIHQDAFVVTDTKDSNIRFLRYLQTNSGNIRPQLIIQIYRMSELKAARQLSPRAVWLTVYKYAYPAWAMERICGVDAFVIPVASYGTYRNRRLMERAHFYVHSVPTQSIDETFRRLPGIYGMYVD